MEEIEKLEIELPIILQISEDSWKMYREKKQEYHEKSDKLKHMYIEYTNKQKEKLKQLDEEQKAYKEEVVETYKDIVKALIKDKRGRPKKREIVDRCGIEVLRKLSVSEFRECCKMNKIKYYTKMRKNELIRSLLKL